MNPSSDTAAAIIGTLGVTGLEAYQISQGQPVAITQAVPGAVVQTGSASFSQLGLVLGIIIVAVLIFK